MLIKTDKNNQKGMSSIALLLVLMVAGLTMLCVSRMAPAYVDNRYAITALKGLDSPTGNMADITKSDIKKQMQSFFLINRVNKVIPESLEIKKTSKKTMVTMDYEIRVPILYNVDVVMTFKNHWDSSAPEKCCKPESESKD